LLIDIGDGVPRIKCTGRTDDSYCAVFCSVGVVKIRLSTRYRAGFFILVYTRCPLLIARCEKSDAGNH